MALPDNNDPVTPNSSRPSWDTPRANPLPPQQAQPPPNSSPFDSAPAPLPSYAAPTETEVRYDLAGNPIPGSQANIPSGQPNYAAGRPAGVWPPAPASPYGYGGQVTENGTDRVSRLKWNWGAFLIPFWWSIFNGQRGLASAIVLVNIASRWTPAPYVYALSLISFGIAVYLGVMGHRLAWTSGRFGGDYESFISTQRAWMIWGFVLAALITVGVIAAVVLVPGVLSTLSGTPHTNTYGGSSGTLPGQ